jgi:hypothetical protein
VIKNGKQGVINTSGSMLISPEYDEIRRPGTFGVTSAIVIKNGKQGVINSSGNPMIWPDFDKIEKVGSAGNLMALVKKDGKYGVVNSTGKIMVNTQYDSIGYFKYYQPKKPETIIESKTDGPDDRVVVKSFRVPFIYITWTSTTAGSDNYSVSDTRYGRSIAMVKKGNKYGYIDTNGEEVVPVTYRNASEIDIDSYLNRVTSGK